MYPTVEPQDAKYLISFGNLCSVIKRLPTSAVLSVGLVVHGGVPTASGGLTDVWPGAYQGTEVAIKAFRIYSARTLEETEEVRVECV